jgi:hypothetical protein
MPRPTRARTEDGTSMVGIGAYWCACRNPAKCSARYGLRPVRHSKNTQVAAYTSVAGLDGLVAHCSGAMYDGVPEGTPASPLCVAIPKSASLLVPSAWMSTFSGL